MTDNLKISVYNMEKELNITQGFLYNLKDQDDWSFVIKAHSLLEGSVSQLLSQVMGNENFNEIFSQMELSNKKTGKVAFVKALNILEKRDRRFISFFSELRNKLVHNVSNVDFSIEKYVNSLSKAKERELIKKLQIIDATELIPYKSKDYKVEELIKIDAKFLFWYLSVYLIAIIYQNKELRIEQKLQKETKEKLNYYQLKKEAMEASRAGAIFDKIISTMKSS